MWNEEDVILMNLWQDLLHIRSSSLIFWTKNTPLKLQLDPLATRTGSIIYNNPSVVCDQIKFKFLASFNNDQAAVLLMETKMICVSYSLMISRAWRNEINGYTELHKFSNYSLQQLSCIFMLIGIFGVIGDLDSTTAKVIDTLTSRSNLSITLVTAVTPSPFIPVINQDLLIWIPSYITLRL